jgi:hypothetical protein
MPANMSAIPAKAATDTAAVAGDAAGKGRDTVTARAALIRRTANAIHGTGTGLIPLPSAARPHTDVNATNAGVRGATDRADPTAGPARVLMAAADAAVTGVPAAAAVVAAPSVVDVTARSASARRSTSLTTIRGANR